MSTLTENRTGETTYFFTRENEGEGTSLIFSDESAQFSLFAKPAGEAISTDLRLYLCRQGCAELEAQNGFSVDIFTTERYVRDAF